jgi:flagellar motor switch protein FliN/FliY
VEIRLIWPLPLIASLAALVGGAKLQEEAVPHGQAHRSAVSPQESEALRLSQPAIFSQLTPEQGKEKSENIDLILDIPVSIKAFLGKSELTLRELIELAPGKVFELDKFAGEPIDLIVNDRLVAHGEIIIMDEKFGVKVMDVLGKAERLYNLR